MPQDMPPAGGYGPVQYKVRPSSRNFETARGTRVVGVLWQERVCDDVK